MRWCSLRFSSRSVLTSMTLTPGASKEARRAARRAEELLEVIRVFVLGQEGEDAAAVVVDEDDGCLHAEAPRGQQAVHVVGEREGANDEDELAVAAGRRPGGGGG